MAFRFSATTLITAKIYGDAPCDLEVDLGGTKFLGNVPDPAGGLGFLAFD